jgi:hypothetical protein
MESFRRKDFFVYYYSVHVFFFFFFLLCPSFLDPSVVTFLSYLGVSFERLLPLTFLVSAQQQNLFLQVVAGTGSGGYNGDNQPATSVQLYFGGGGGGVYEDITGILYVGDYDNCLLRKIDLQGIMKIAAGIYGSPATSGTSGFGTSVSIGYPFSVTGDTMGTFLYFSDQYFVWKYQLSNGFLSRYAGAAPYVGTYSGDGQQAATAQLNNPFGVSLSSMGLLYICDFSNCRVRVVATNGIITTFAGTGANSFGGDGGFAINSYISNPRGVYADTIGNVFIADSGNSRIRKVDSSGIIKTFAGGGAGGDGGQATSASITANAVYDVKGDRLGNIYIADNCKIRMVNTAGIISTIAGTGTCGLTMTFSPSTSSSIQTVYGLLVNNNFNVYFTEYPGLIQKTVSLAPTSRPSSQPSDQPSSQPSCQPSSQPSCQPSSKPSYQPASKPSCQPSSMPSGQPSGRPSLKPSCQPSSMPSGRPSLKPSGKPFSMPSCQPSSMPSGQPSSMPSGQPFSMPSCQPSSMLSGQPSSMPSGQPSSKPSCQPSSMPSGQPSLMPSGQPSSQPSYMPSYGPSLQPSFLPSSMPSGQPSLMLSCQPSSMPSGQPYSKPSCQPSSMPLNQPSSMPSFLPSSKPSIQPFSMPSCQPSSMPSGQPSSMPSGQPFSMPSCQPSSMLSGQPSSMPSGQPSSKPSCQPSSMPSGQPSLMPSGQPSSQPSYMPSYGPSLQPSFLPSSMPSGQPSLMLSCQPSSMPSGQPYSKPSCQPSSMPLNQPSSMPSFLPSSKPSIQPSSMPSCIRTIVPSAVPSSFPSGSPTSDPSSSPKVDPSQRPIAVPGFRPTLIPTLQPSAQPSSSSSMLPSSQLLRLPTGFPTPLRRSCLPSSEPSSRPVSNPSSYPSFQPFPSLTSILFCRRPTGRPSTIPSTVPLAEPSLSSGGPTPVPTRSYSSNPSTIRRPSRIPTQLPNRFPTVSVAQTLVPSPLTNVFPTAAPTTAFSISPSNDDIRFKGSLFLFGIYVATSVTVVKNIYLDRPIVVSPPDTYVVFGQRKNDKFPETFRLESGASSSFYSSLSSSSTGALSRDSMSRSSSIIGDVNGDNAVDLMIGYPYSSLCVVYLGKMGYEQEGGGAGWSNMIVSFVFRGLYTGDGFGWAIDGLGDINHDGCDDIAIAAKNSGIVYILFGKVQFREVVSMSSLTEEDGYRIVGSLGTVNTGMAISSGRDFNKDGKSEIIVSTMTSTSSACMIYMVSLASVGKSKDIFLESSDNVLLRMNGPPSAFSGLSLAGLGDINGDGYDDIAIGVVPYRGDDQCTYVIYGRNSTTYHVLDLSHLQPSDGFSVKGGGFLVASPGDVNNDGINDLLIVSYSGWHSSSNAYLLRFPRNVTASPSFNPSSAPSNDPASSPSSLPSLVSSTFVPSNLSSLAKEEEMISHTPTIVNATALPTRAPLRTSKPTSRSARPSFVPSIMATSLPTKVPSVVPSVSPSYVPYLSPTKAPRVKPTGSPISSSFPSSQPTSSPSTNVNNAYEERTLTSGGVYDLSSSSEQRVIVGGTGNFVITGGNPEKIYTLQPKPVQRVEIKDYNSKKQKLDFIAFSSLYSVNDLTYSINPLTLYPQGRANSIRGHRRLTASSFSPLLLQSFYDFALRALPILSSQEDATDDHEDSSEQKIVLSSHKSFTTIHKESFIFRILPAGIASGNTSSNPFNISTMISLSVLLVCCFTCLVGYCENDKRNTQKKNEKDLIEQSSRPLDDVSDIENQRISVSHSASASSYSASSSMKHLSADIDVAHTQQQSHLKGSSSLNDSFESFTFSDHSFKSRKSSSVSDVSVMKKQENQVNDVESSSLNERDKSVREISSAQHSICDSTRKTMTSSLSPNQSVMLKHNSPNIIPHPQQQPPRNEVGSSEINKPSDEDGDRSDLIDDDDDDEWNAILNDFSDDDNADLDKGEVDKKDDDDDDDDGNKQDSKLPQTLPFTKTLNKGVIIVDCNESDKSDESDFVARIKAFHQSIEDEEEYENSNNSFQRDNSDDSDSDGDGSDSDSDSEESHHSESSEITS